MSEFGINESKLSNSFDNSARTTIGSIASTTAVGKFISGARCIVKINGAIAVFATKVSWRVNTEQDEIFTIDSTTPYEMAPKRVTVDGTIGGFHLPGWTPSAQAIQSDILSFMFHKYISIEVRDRSSDTLLFQTNKAVVTEWSEDISAENLAQMTLRWKAIGWMNELPGPTINSTGLGGLDYPEKITPPTSIS